MNTVNGYCPMGCGTTLYVDGGMVSCSSQDCPRPNAVSEILSDTEIEHIVVVGEYDFTVKHPLRERLDNELVECGVFEYLQSLNGPPVPPGQHYRMVLRGNPAQWHYDKVTI